jgi:PilZ domain
MALSPVLAILGFESNWTFSGLLLPVGVGVFAALGLIGALHLFTLWRKGSVAADSTNAMGQLSDDPLVDGSTSEQRLSFRRKGNPVEVQIVDTSTQTPPVMGYVTNRSVGGLCLEMQNSVELLAELKIRPTNAPHIAPWVNVVVRNCRKTEHGYDIGCQFVKIPPWPILMMFG